MKAALSLFLIALLFAGSAIATVSEMAAMQGYLWSGEQNLGRSSSISSRISSSEIASVIKAALAGGAAEGSFSALHFAKEARTAIVFVNKVSNSHIFSQAVEGETFFNLKEIVANQAVSSVSLSNVETTEALSSILTHLHFETPVRIVVTHDGNALVPTKAGTHIISMPALKNYIAQHVDAKARNLIIVQFDATTMSNKLAQNDAAVADIMASVSELTEGRYVAAWVAEQEVHTAASSHHHTRAAAIPTFSRVGAVNNRTNNTVATIYIQPNMLNGLLVSFMLLIILGVGLNCMSNISSPARFELPDDKKHQ